MSCCGGWKGDHNYDFFSCRALIGASIFISTVVLGTIIIVVNVRSEHIGKSNI